ncbi:hypothetical protein [Algoriphagus litoralis]|uniref:hypothetical protein n=1 Tax=Algoriphagus litoralis TaxID=2202829 RepID=UPI0018E51AAD|nr:hypothetical protein [Algoriphagus litoralis]
MTENSKNKIEKTEKSIQIEISQKPRCGIIMPISAIDGCGPEHWLEILSILKEVAIDSGFEPNLVSDADDIGIIQKRIIQNVYNNDIIICDVSCKNPNVMFELGMRLAFDKATVIIKDDKTDYSFDTGVIEHLGYPRDLRFHKILEFKENLKKKLTSTFEKSKTDPNYSTFLKNFGEYKIAHLQEKEVSSDNYILNSLDEIRFEIRRLRNNQIHSVNSQRELLDEKTLDVYRTNLIKRFYYDFMSENKVGSMSDLDVLKDELFEYISNQPEVQQLFKSKNMLRSYVNNILP